MTITVSCGIGSSARSWTLNIPGTVALAGCVPDLTALSRPNPATIKRALCIAEPYLALVAAAAGAGAPEVLLVVAAVAVAKHLLAGASPDALERVPASPQTVPGAAPCAVRRVPPRRLPDPAHLVDTTPEDAPSTTLESPCTGRG